MVLGTDPRTSSMSGRYKYCKLIYGAAAASPRMREIWGKTYRRQLARRDQVKNAKFVRPSSQGFVRVRISVARYYIKLLLP